MLPPAVVNELSVAEKEATELFMLGGKLTGMD